jgi:hypothetical protein
MIIKIKRKDIRMYWSGIIQSETTGEAILPTELKFLKNIGSTSYPVY